MLQLEDFFPHIYMPVQLGTKPQTPPLQKHALKKKKKVLFENLIKNKMQK